MVSLGQCTEVVCYLRCKIPMFQHFTCAHSLNAIKPLTPQPESNNLLLLVSDGAHIDFLMHTELRKRVGWMKSHIMCLLQDFGRIHMSICKLHFW